MTTIARAAATAQSRPSRRARRRCLAAPASLLAGLLLLAAAAPAAGEIQEGDPNLERALALEARAESYHDRAQHAGQVASLYREAARFRTDADPMKVQNLRMAARLGFRAGDTRRAMGDAEAAAKLATRQGDVVEASHSWLDAAWIAVDLGDGRRAADYVMEARLLAGSPLLSQADRESIEARIAG